MRVMAAVLGVLGVTTRCLLTTGLAVAQVGIQGQAGLVVMALAAAAAQVLAVVAVGVVELLIMGVAASDCLVKVLAEQLVPQTVKGVPVELIVVP
jgi:hypothetical protein